MGFDSFFGLWKSFWSEFIFEIMNKTALLDPELDHRKMLFSIPIEFMWLLLRKI